MYLFQPIIRKKIILVVFTTSRYDPISNEFTQRAIEIFHEPMLAVPLIK